MGILFFLSSGLFLGWSLGANDAANVFGTAVGTRMVRFRTAAWICAVFVVLGATLSGTGAAHTLGRLGSVSTLAGAFTVALAAALTTFWMTRLKMPVSTSQAIVGAILGWNFYTASLTDTSSLTRIMLTWVACPLLSGAIAVVLFMGLRAYLRLAKVHLLRLDAGTRAGLLVVGAFGSYSLGANNIANVMGVFVPDNPFRDLRLLGVTVSGTQQLFFLGAVAIGVGVFTYSERVMRTVGGGLARLSPVPALVVVLAQSLTLFLFASARLEHFLASHGLPTFPLVPVSSSQAVVGAIIGLALFKGGRNIRYRVLGEISLGWIATPILAGVTAIFLLAFVDNVFNQEVSRPVSFRLDEPVLTELARRGVDVTDLGDFADQIHGNPLKLSRDLADGTDLDAAAVAMVLDLSRLGHWYLDPALIAEEVDATWLTPEQVSALRQLAGYRYTHWWRLQEDLRGRSEAWRNLPDIPRNRLLNKELSQKWEYLERLFAVRE